jgi:imidazolonepropionase
VNNQLVKLKELIDSKQLEVDNVDVFCEKGVFDVNQSEAILKQAQSLSNLNINFHSNELFPLNSVEVTCFN